jgi:hypothetical protein
MSSIKRMQIIPHPKTLELESKVHIRRYIKRGHCSRSESNCQYLRDRGETRFLNSVDPELEEDDRILNHSSQRSNQPWKIGEEIFLLCRMAKNLYPRR